MIYFVPLFIAIILRHYGLTYKDEIGKGIIEIILAMALFADVIKVRFSVLVQYHFFSIISSLLALIFYGGIFWYTLPNEVWPLLAPLLLIAPYDIRASKDIRYSDLIPPRVKQFLSLDGLLRSLFVAFILSVIRFDITSTIYSISLGAFLGFVTLGLLYLLRQNALLYIIPLLTYFMGKFFIGEGIVTTLVCGIVIGNLYRHACVDVIALFGKYYPWLFSITLFIFGIKFGETLFQTLRTGIFLTTIFLIFIVNAVIISLIYLFVKMQWQTFLFGALSNIPGILAISLTILVFDANQGFVAGILLLSLLLHALLLPRITTWYGDIFTGRDMCSKLEEHKPTIELPY